MKAKKSSMDFHGIKINVIRSWRKSMSLQISRQGDVTLRAPLLAGDGAVMRLLEAKHAWLTKNLEKIEQDKILHSDEQLLSEEEIIALAQSAKEYIPQRAAYFAPLLGVKYNRITIRAQRTRWGSCSEKGNLNFNCLLMLTPPDIIDSVIVHELCHLREMNHSARFYELVSGVFPEYNRCRKWLKENGSAIMRRLP